MKVLICGSRKWSEPRRIIERIEQLPAETIIIEGGASGADSWARWAAKECELHVADVKPLYKGVGNDHQAPKRRNSAMVLLEPDLVIAFTVGSKLTAGTADMVRKAQHAGIPCEIHFGAGHVQHLPPPEQQVRAS
jgi:YspA, cpYpsA-related SLOG family